MSQVAILAVSADQLRKAAQEVEAAPASDRLSLRFQLLAIAARLAAAGVPKPGTGPVPVFVPLDAFDAANRLRTHPEPSDASDTQEMASVVT